MFYTSFPYQMFPFNKYVCSFCGKEIEGNEIFALIEQNSNGITCCFDAVCIDKYSDFMSIWLMTTSLEI